jgi:UDP-N-acetylmuramate:L-alanyl-gamma-D-glutamyl-meso-diaminopimelate ligase
MRVHILGICGTFMGGIAAIAKEAGHAVSGADQNVYPPMSTQLEALGIKLVDGYERPIDADVESVVVGNALSRGKPVVEALLNSGRAYTSGPEWLADYVLRDKWVLAVSGTHGKTTTTSMLAWILEYAGLKPGFLIGGVPVTGLEVLPSAEISRRPSPRMVTSISPDGRKASAQAFGRPEATTSTLKSCADLMRGARVWSAISGVGR